MRLRSLIVAVLSAFLGLMAVANAFAADKRFYDSQGRYQGRQDASGRYYDSQGRYQGKVDANGRYYDSRGRYQGRQDGNGRYYDSQGCYQGKQDVRGRYYDSQGRDATKGGAMPTAVTTTRRAVIRDAISKLGRCDQRPAFSSSVHLQ